mgnify:CR=1 FL=1
MDVDICAQLYLNQLQFRISYHSMTAACGHSYNVTWLYHLLHIIHDGFSLTRYDYSHLIPVLVTVIVHTVIADTELKLIEVQLGADINVHDKQKFELER